MDTFIQHPDYFFIRVEGRSRLARVSRDELIYVQSDWNYVLLVADKQRYLVHLSLKKMSEYLQYLAFAQVHKRYVVNLGKISDVAGNRIRMCDGTEIPLGRSFRKVFLEILAKQIIKQK